MEANATTFLLAERISNEDEIIQSSGTSPRLTGMCVSTLRILVSSSEDNITTHLLGQHEQDLIPEHRQS